MFFYTKQIRVLGKENIPKKGAVLFTANHPNGLLDPLIIATNNPRIQHFLVRAAVFKNPIVKKLLATLNLMPIYRIRDGVQELSKNKGVFETCFQILNEQKSLMIFPEGSHNRKRTIRPLSKGFTRIVFGAMEANPELQITIIPVGLTYQNSSIFPSKIALHYGAPIEAHRFFNPKEQHTAALQLKKEVSHQLQKLSVHIPDDEHYTNTITQLNNSQVDFTEVSRINQYIQDKNLVHTSKTTSLLSPIFRILFIANTAIPWLFWKFFSKKVDEIEFVDTFRFGLGAVLAPLSYLLQTLLVGYYFGKIAGIYYLLLSLLIALLYVKTHPTPTENNRA